MLLKQMCGGFFLDERLERRVKGEQPVANLLPRSVAPPLTKRHGKAPFRRAQHLWRQIQRDKVTNIRLPFLPFSFQRRGSLAQSSTNSWSRNGERTSRLRAMLAMSSLVSSEYGS